MNVSPIKSLSAKFQKILLIRNDNIGDLICSIPAIQLIRESYPDATIHLLVNSYNAPVVEPLVGKMVDKLVIYHKTKHTGLNFGQLLRLFRFYVELRGEKYNAAVMLVGGTSKQAISFAKWSSAENIYGYGEEASGPEFKEGLHEVEYSWNLALQMTGKERKPPEVIPYPLQRTGTRTAIQITSRKPGNRWTTKNFIELIKKVFETTKEKPILLWSPGDSSTATHPGDDDKAADIIGQTAAYIEPRPTATLAELIDVLKECRYMITPDGGAMHLANAMGIRVLALFGQSDPVRWRPWGKNSIFIQSPSRTVNDIGVDEVSLRFKDLSR